MGFNNNFNSQGGATVLTDLEVDGTTVVVDETNDRVGIGTDSPDGRLHVMKGSAGSVTASGDGNALVVESDDVAGMTLLSPGDGVIYFGDAADNDEGRIVYKHSDNSMNLWTNNAVRLTIDSSGDATFTGDVTVSGGDITYGNGQNATASVTATAHDTAGKNLTITSGATTAGTTNNIAGGSLTIQAGQGKGSGAGGDIIFQTANAGSSGSTLNSLATALTISDDLSSTFVGPVIVTSAMAASGSGNTFVTFADGDDTPSVATGNLFKHHASTETITMFDNGLSGQIITVISTAAITYDVTGTNLKGGSADIVTANGDVTQWCFDGTNWYLLQFMDVSADHSTIGGGGGADANDVDHILHQQVFS